MNTEELYALLDRVALLLRRMVIDPTIEMGHTHCNDCGMVYGSDSWIEAVVADDIWNKIKPTESDDECGILCISCINRRLKILGYDNVPVWFHGTEALTAREGDRMVMNPDAGTIDNTDAFSEGGVEVKCPKCGSDNVRNVGIKICNKCGIWWGHRKIEKLKKRYLCGGVGDCPDELAAQCVDADWCNTTDNGQCGEPPHSSGLRPIECTPVGEYRCQVPMPLNGRVQGIDICISDIVAALNAANIPTDASCCGHGEMMGSILLTDGRVLRVRFNRPLSRETK